jgi:hypothetical protein
MSESFACNEFSRINYRDKSAVMSECGKYRYSLKRKWWSYIDYDRTIVFLMLNPSIADANEDDATIRKCVRYADRWGYNSITVVNLFAYRSTNPKDLSVATDPIGPDNDRIILQECKNKYVVCAWGATIEKSKLPILSGRPESVVRVLSTDVSIRLMCLSLTSGKSPGHPIYQSGDITPIEYNVCQNFNRSSPDSSIKDAHTTPDYTPN